MSNNDLYNLSRFVTAQSTTYATALAEINNGHKDSHWMWFIFPQHINLGHSPMAIYYGISSVEEASAYLRHPILGARLREISQTLLQHSTGDPQSIFGEIDTLKLKSCMTLFDLVLPDDVFKQVLDTFFNGEKDLKTIRLASQN